MDQRNEIETKVNDQTVVSVIAYLTLVGWFIAILFLNKPKNDLVDFHLRQALGINLLFILSGIVIIVPFIGWAAGIVGYILAVVLWIQGVMSALKGEQKRVSILGDQFQEWFQGL